VVTQGEYTNLQLHDDTIWYVVIFVLLLAGLGLAYYLWRKYQRNVRAARPVRAMDRMRQMEMQALAPPKASPFYLPPRYHPPPPLNPSHPFAPLSSHQPQPTVQMPPPSHIPTATVQDITE
jgi:hypothetical protein